MYRIDTGSKTINGERVNTFIRAVSAGDQLYEAEAGTTGFRGGGRQSGSRCYLRLSALTKADFFARVRESESGKPVGVELCFSGDQAGHLQVSNVAYVLGVFKKGGNVGSQI